MGFKLKYFLYDFSASVKMNLNVFKDENLQGREKVIFSLFSVMKFSSSQNLITSIIMSVKLSSTIQSYKWSRNTTWHLKNGGKKNVLVWKKKKKIVGGCMWAYVGFLDNSYF